jgi:hypothetical protein
MAEWINSDIANSEVMKNLDHLKRAVKLMTDNSGLDLKTIIERFWENWSFIAAGFEAFEWTKVKPGEMVKLMKEEALKNNQMLRDIEKALLYGMMYIVKPRWSTQEESLKNYIPEIMETVGFIYTIMGDQFFQYVLKRRTQWMKASVDKMKKIIRGMDDTMLIRGLNMPGKVEAMKEMVESKEEIMMDKIERARKKQTTPVKQEDALSPNDQDGERTHNA